MLIAHKYIVDVGPEHMFLGLNQKMFGVFFSVELAYVKYSLQQV